MAEPSRYSVSDEQAGLLQGVLKNKLGITDQRTLDDAEALVLPDAYNHFFSLLARGELVFGTKLLLQIHTFIFEPLYPWAGKMRTVDVSKDGVLFVPAKYIEPSLHEIEKMLKVKISVTKKDAARELALMQCELNAIHPFREGNGRAIRLFLDLVAAHAGFNPVDWSKKSHRAYIAACKEGMMKECARMERIIFAGLSKRK